MEIKIDVGLDDIFESVCINPYSNSPSNYYKMRKGTDFQKRLIDTMVQEMLKNLDYYFSEKNNIAYQVKEELIKNYKDEIIDKIVEKTSKSIISGKRIRDFRKELDNDDTKNK